MTVQLGLAGMPRRLFGGTPSRWTTGLDCPRRYRLTYLDRPAPPRGGPRAHRTPGGLDPADEPVGGEPTVSTRSAARTVSGRVDRRGKSGRAVLTTGDARGSLALALHALADARTLRRDRTRVELHHLPTGRVVAVDHTEPSPARHLAPELA